MTLCYLGLGSNLRSPERQLRQALHKISKLSRTIILKRSKLYFNKSQGLKAQPHYCNMVLAINSSLTPQHLLTKCQHIEKLHKRVRKKRWGARTLDIDLLLYGTQTLNFQNLKIPHPQMLKRDFVLIPLCEILATTSFHLKSLHF